MGRRHQCGRGKRRGAWRSAWNKLGIYIIGVHGNSYSFLMYWSTRRSRPRPGPSSGTLNTLRSLLLATYVGSDVMDEGAK